MACGQGKGDGPSDAAVADGAGDARGNEGANDAARTGTVGCGGTAQASGTSPVGPFMATGLNVLILQNCNAVQVTALDDGSGASFEFSLPLPNRDAGTQFQMTGATVFGSFSSPTLDGGRAVQVSTTVTFMGSDPFGAPAGGGSWGTLDGTFETVTGATGVSISGSFSSPYCSFNKGGCSG